MIDLFAFVRGFTITYSKGSRSTSASVDVNISGAAPPSITITKKAPVVDRVNTNSKLFLAADISTRRRKLHLTWDVTGTGLDHPLDLSDRNLCPSGFKGRQLSIAPDILQARYSPYTARLIAKTLDGQTNQTLGILVNGGPKNGQVKISPSNGTS